MCSQVWKRERCWTGRLHECFMSFPDQKGTLHFDPWIELRMLSFKKSFSRHSESSKIGNSIFKGKLMHSNTASYSMKIWCPFYWTCEPHLLSQEGKTVACFLYLERGSSLYFIVFLLESMVYSGSIISHLLNLTQCWGYGAHSRVSQMNKCTIAC